MKTSTYLFQFIALAVTISLGTACHQSDEGSTQHTPTDTSTAPAVDNAIQSMTAEATVAPRSQSTLAGSVTFVQENQHVTMTAVISGGTPATEHAIHIHETGDCSANDGTSAGGHWNPTDQSHGKWGSDAFHVGDIGNLQTDSLGNARIERTTDRWCVGCGDPNRDVVGKAIIVHEGPDDFTSQPSGAAGSRIGCGVIELR